MMQIVLLLITLYCWSSSSFGVVVKDDAGRTVMVPENLERIYAAGPPASIILYSLAPDMLLGWNRPLRAEEKAFLLARYAEQVFTQVRSTLATVPAQERPRVYYGRGPDGLQTGAGGAINVELLEIAGAINVAAQAGGHRHVLIEVSTEQILQWDPQVILTLDPHFYKHAKSDPLWSRVDAVRNKRVYLAPRAPFGWFDRPPSVNRLIGLPWLLHTLYSQYNTQLDLDGAARAFYALFYDVDLSGSQLERLLEGSQ